MSGINRELTIDNRHIAKHLPDTLQMQRLLQRGGAAHVFNNVKFETPKMLAVQDVLPDEFLTFLS
ncbi:DUF6972 family protein [Tychonema sp. BBK16]|uniref:DUF6972 family protein n=1 Tax=Tychonema sp. BBK16 TaxID=2699888 RepID=UPI0038D32059